MKSNREIFNEAFFKKATYKDKLAKKLPQYTPADLKTNITGAVPGTMALQVSDTDEVKRRLAGTFGAAFGNNNIKSLASKSLKTFPIIVSDNIEPETVVMLKKLLEEQYAEYINLLVSNTVVNLADYRSGTDGNIAIQALDSISSDDFSKSRIANDALRTGEINKDKVFQNLPLYNVLRMNEAAEYFQGNDAILDELFADACIVETQEQAKQLAEFFLDNSDEIAELNESYDGYIENLKVVLEGTAPTTVDIDGLNLEIDPDAYSAVMSVIKSTKMHQYESYRDIVLNTEKKAVERLRAIGQMKTILAGHTFTTSEGTLNIILPRSLDDIDPTLLVEPEEKKEEPISDLIIEFVEIPSRRAEITERVGFPVYSVLLKYYEKWKRALEAEEKNSIIDDFEEFLGRVSLPHLIVRSPDAVEDKEDTVVSDEKDLHPGLILDNKKLESYLNKSVREMLNEGSEETKILKEKFQTAIMLLTSRRIAGLEFYNYCTMRLGIPVSDSVRRRLLTEYKVGDVRAYGARRNKSKEDFSFVVTDSEAKQIARANLNATPLIKDILSTKFDKVVAGVGAAAGTTAIAVGALHSASNAGLLSLGGTSVGVLVPALVGTIWWPLILGSAIGASTFLLSKVAAKALKKKKQKLMLGRQEGWERTEMLVEKWLSAKKQSGSSPSKNIDYDKLGSSETDGFGYSISKIKNDDDIKKIPGNQNTAQDEVIKGVDRMNASYLSIQKELSKLLREEIEPSPFKTTFNEMFDVFKEASEIFNESYSEVLIECADDKLFQAELLSEKLTTAVPMKVQYIEKKPDADVLLTPDFMSKSTFAYGSTEIERKDNKDRRYNQPLIMTVSFKERFSDGKISDNELTAVIGILGKVIRVPSEEMQYILASNTEGKTIEGFFHSGNIENAISDLMGMSKIAKEAKALPQSLDVWKNLEKVSTLALSNKITGKRTNNVANAHIIFSQKEVDAVRNETGVDYLRDMKKSVALMKRYSAFTLMIANDPGQRVAILDDQDNTSWNVVPYSALAGKDSGDQLNAALTKMMRL